MAIPIVGLLGSVAGAVLSSVIKALLTKRMIITIIMHLLDHVVAKSASTTDDKVWKDVRAALEKEIA